MGCWASNPGRAQVGTCSAHTQAHTHEIYWDMSTEWPPSGGIIYPVGRPGRNSYMLRQWPNSFLKVPPNSAGEITYWGKTGGGIATVHPCEQRSSDMTVHRQECICGQG